VVKIDAKNLPTVASVIQRPCMSAITVMAFGNPFGLNFYCHSGNCQRTRPVRKVVSKQFRISFKPTPQSTREIQAERSWTSEARWSASNTAILSGNSGPGGEGGFIGIGFAIPINMAKRTPNLSSKTGKVTRGYLGVSIGPVTPELAQQFKVPDTSGASSRTSPRAVPQTRPA